MSLRLVLIILLLGGCTSAAPAVVPSSTPAPVTSPSPEPSPSPSPTDEVFTDEQRSELQSKMDDFFDPSTIYEGAVEDKCRDLTSSRDDYLDCLDANLP